MGKILQLVEHIIESIRGISEKQKVGDCEVYDD
jgi:hypothetical protein